MAQEKEPKGITRRQFLKGITALGASALLSSCGVEEEPVSQKPTETLRPAATTPPPKVPTQESSPIPEPTLTPEPTSTPEVVSLPGIILTGEYLKNAFAGIGGEEVITNGQEEVSMVQFGQEYVSQSWGQEIDFTKLSEDPVSSLKYLISLGAYQGQEGVFTPGKQKEEVIFPQLATLSLARLALKSVPYEMEQKEQDYREWISPLNLTLRPQTQMTVIGLLNESKPGAEVMVDKEAPEGELSYALVAFTDYLRVSEEGIPRHYLAILPTHFPADPENRNTLSLQNLLRANGYQYDSQRKEITFADQDNNGQEQKTVLELNRVEGEELTNQLRQEVGFYFVDQIDGELIKNPVVPYPAEMPSVWDIKEGENEEGNFELILRSRDPEGNFQDFSRVRYNEEENSWNWEKVVPPEPISYQTIYDNILTFPGWNQEPVTFVDSEGRMNIINSNSYMLYVRNENLSFSLNGDFKVQFAFRARGISNPDQQQTGEIMFYGTPMTNDPSWFQVGINESNQIISFVYDSAKKEIISIIDQWANISAPESGSLSVLFEGVMSGKGERVVIYDDQGNEIVRKELPFPIFSQNLYFSLNSINSTQDPKGVQMTVDYLRLLSPQGTNNVVKN